MPKPKGLSGAAALTIMISSMLAIGIAGWAVLRWWLPQYYFEVYPLIPLTFMIFAVIMVLLYVKWEMGVAAGKTTQQKVTVNIAGAKMGKLLLSMTLLLLYWKSGAEQTNSFFIVFAIYYAVFLVLETLVFMGVTKRYTKKG